MPPMPTTSNCACRASLPPAIFRRMPCRLPDTATKFWFQKHERRACRRAFSIWREGQNFLGGKWYVTFWPFTKTGVKTDAKIASKSSREPGLAAWVPAQNDQSMIESGDVEHMIQLCTHQDLAHKMRRIHQLELHSAATCPLMQRKQRSQAAGVQRLHLRQVQHHNAAAFF